MWFGRFLFGTTVTDGIVIHFIKLFCHHLALVAEKLLKALARLGSLIVHATLFEIVFELVPLLFPSRGNVLAQGLRELGRRRIASRTLLRGLSLLALAGAGNAVTGVRVEPLSTADRDVRPVFTSRLAVKLRLAIGSGSTE